MFCLVTTSLFLFVRVFVDQRITLDLTHGGFAKDTDFIKCQFLVIGILNAFCAPAFLITFIVKYFLDEKSAEYKLWKEQMKLGWFQVIAIFYLVFVSSRKSPKWWKSYILWSRLIHGSLALLNFIVIPIFTIANVFANWDLINSAKTGNFIACLFIM
jgi:hypothetical protein